MGHLRKGGFELLERSQQEARLQRSHSQPASLTLLLVGRRMRRTLGGVCDSDPDCIGSSNTCVNEACVPNPDVGEPCDDKWDCCGLRFDDVPFSCISGVCAPESNIGGPCEDYEGCTRNSFFGEYFCLNSECTAASGQGGFCEQDDGCLGLMSCQNVGLLGLLGFKVCAPAQRLCKSSDAECGPFLECEYGRCEPTDDQGNACFSGHNIVDVKDKGFILMSDLEINDWVRVEGEDNYSLVHSFGHYQPDKVTEYLQIEVSDSQGRLLEISPEHLLFVHCLDTKKDDVVSASSVKVGDILVAQDSKPTQVIAIKKIRRRGAYSPLTATGSIVVSGLLASNYVTRSWLHDQVPGLLLHWLQHGAASPHHLFCWLTNCEDEAYNNVTGFSQWVMFWNHLEQWQLGLHPYLQACFLALLLISAAAAMLLGAALTASIPSFVLHVFIVVIGCYILKTAQRSTTSNGKIRKVWMLPLNFTPLKSGGKARQRT